MKKIILTTLVFLLFFSFSVLPAEAKTRKAKRAPKTKIINCGFSNTTAHKIFIGAGGCYSA